MVEQNAVNTRASMLAERYLRNWGGVGSRVLRGSGQGMRNTSSQRTQRLRSTLLYVGSSDVTGVLILHHELCAVSTTVLYLHLVAERTLAPTFVDSVILNVPSAKSNPRFQQKLPAGPVAKLRKFQRNIDLQG